MSKIVSANSILWTLQYCLETFAQNCQCGTCDPCTKGQADLRESIEALQKQLVEEWPTGSYLLQRESTVVKCVNRSALLQLIRDIVPGASVRDDISNELVAALIARKNLTLTAF